MLKHAINKIKEDIKVIYEKDPAATNFAEVLFCYPGLQALISHRIAHKLAYWNIVADCRVTLAVFVTRSA